jgi:5-amino-6-(5-phosphoribosylamino)uracil reductase
MSAKKKTRFAMSADGKLLAGEGGGEALQTLAETDSIEEIEVEIFPQILGGANTPTLTGLPGEFLPKPLDFRMTSMKVVEGRCVATYRRVSGRAC